LAGFPDQLAESEWFVITPAGGGLSAVHLRDKDYVAIHFHVITFQVTRFEAKREIHVPSAARDLKIPHPGASGFGMTIVTITTQSRQAG